MLRTRAEIIPAVIALAAGVASWELVRHMGGRNEAWDDPNYWQIGYPLLFLTALLLGMIWRAAPWRWVVIMFGAQAAWSFVLAMIETGVPNLFPMGVLLFALLGLPCLAAAYLGKWLAGRAPA